MSALRIAVLLGAEPYQVHHVAGIAWQLARRGKVELEVIATLPETLAQFEALSNIADEKLPNLRLLHTPMWAKMLQKLRVLGTLKTRIMQHPRNRAMLSTYDLIVTPTDHAGVLASTLNPRPVMVYVNHGVGGRAASYSEKYLNFDFVVVASRKDESRLLEERLIRPDHYVVAYPKAELARTLAQEREPTFGGGGPTVLFNAHSKRSLRSWERFAKPLILHARSTRDFALIVAPHMKLFGRRPKFVWRRWESLGLPGRVLVDLGSPRSMDSTYTSAADIYVGDVSSQLFEFLTEPKPCVFLNAHRSVWKGNKDFTNWELGDVVATPEEAIAAIRSARSRHHLYRAKQVDRINVASDNQPDAARRAASAILAFLVRRSAPSRAHSVMFLVSDLGTGGTGRATMLTINGLASRGADVSLVVMHRGGVLEPQLHPQAKFLAMNARADRGAGMLLTLPRLVRTIRRERPIQVVSAGNHMHVLATLALSLARVPHCDLVLKMTNPVERPNGRTLSNWAKLTWYRWAFGRAAKVLVITDAAKTQLARTFPRIAQKLSVVDNPYVTGAMLRAGEQRASRLPGKLLAVGRLVPQKNYQLLLRALARLKDRTWTLDILGEGPLLQELVRMAGHLGIGHLSAFRGFVPDPLPYLASARALVLSSSWEGQGAVLLEALACGCPVIATRSGPAVAGVLDEGKFGRLVAPNDPEELAAAIRAELDRRADLPADTRQWVSRYEVEAGVSSHAQALGLVDIAHREPVGCRQHA